MCDASSKITKRWKKSITKDQDFSDHAHRGDSPRNLREASMVARSLFKAFLSAQRETYQDLLPNRSAKSHAPLGRFGTWRTRVG